MQMMSLSGIPLSLMFEDAVVVAFESYNFTAVLWLLDIVSAWEVIVAGGVEHLGHCSKEPHSVDPTSPMHAA